MPLYTTTQLPATTAMTHPYTPQLLILRLLVPALLAMLLCNTPSQAQGSCDTDRRCIGRHVLQTSHQGKAAHYTDVDMGPSLQALDTALTIEMWAWLDTAAEAGARHFLAGRWGPRVNDKNDGNDSWVLYREANGDIVFEINSLIDGQGSADNLVARAPAALQPGVWTHVAATLSAASGEARIYVNGELQATATRADIPFTALRIPSGRDLGIQIGGCNGLSDAPQNRTFDGAYDEVKIWSVARTPDDIQCGRLRSLAGNEPALELYYRCNQADGVYELCDATGNGNTGRMRSGAACVPSGRQVVQTVVLSQAAFSTELRCDSTATFAFTVTDTSICGSRVRLSISGPNASSFTVQPTGTLNLTKDSLISGTISVRTNLVDTIRASLVIDPLDRCGSRQTIPILVNRITELTIRPSRIDFDSLWAGCLTKPWIDTVITVVNRSAQVGTPRDITIDSAGSGLRDVFQVVSPPFPIVVAPGDSVRIGVRFRSRDTSAQYADDFLLYSTDRCAPVTAIAATGTVQEVIVLRFANGSRVDSIRFDATCPGQISSPVEYTWENLTRRPITIDAVEIPSNFIGKTLRLPLTLLPATGYPANFVRFRPLSPGVKDSVVVIRTSIEGCDIEQKFFVAGRGLSSDIQFENTVIDLGDVIVGQERTLPVRAENTGPDDVPASFYLQIGDVFLLEGPQGATIPSGSSTLVPVTFRPIAEGDFTDTLCVFDRRCYTNICIPVRGRGVRGTLDFAPARLRIANVLACESQEAVCTITNTQSSAVTLTAMSFVDPAAKFTLLTPAIPPNTTTIPGNGNLQVRIRYTPGDLTGDRADRAFLRFNTGSESWVLECVGNSRTPRLTLSSTTNFGTVELGDTRQRSVTVENSSSVDVTVDSLTIPAPFELVSISRALPTTIAPRDSITAVVRFRPTAETSYSEQWLAWSQSPCPIQGAGLLIGAGTKVELVSDIQLLNFGFVRSCNCEEREIPIVNSSVIHPITIDTLEIRNTATPPSTPNLFSWYSRLSPTGTLPITLPPGAADTIMAVFCPRTLAIDTAVSAAAELYFHAQGYDWQKSSSIALGGTRMLSFRPLPTEVTFVDTPVDTALVAQTVRISIPGVVQNPRRSAIVVDSVTFYPDERVFTVQEALGRPFPFRLQPDSVLSLQLNFTPRAPRLYQARLQLHLSEPCPDVDTTVLVSGLGFAQPFGLQFAFDNQRETIDTFRTTSCDTIHIPLYSSRTIPASLVDISCRVLYDTSAFAFAGVRSAYDNIATGIYLSSSSGQEVENGVLLTLKNYAAVDSLRPFAIVSLLPRRFDRYDEPVAIDSIRFDTEQVILYRILAGTDIGRIIVDKPEVTVLNDLSFGDVFILNCEDRTVELENTGDVPVLVNNLALPAACALVSISPTGFIAPGERATAVVRFCPLDTASLADSARAIVPEPCLMVPGIAVAGKGAVPDHIWKLALSPDFVGGGEIRGAIGDTVRTPLVMRNPLSATYRDTTFWLEDMVMRADVYWNPFQLKFLSAENRIPRTEFSVMQIPGSARITWRDADSVGADTLVFLTFLVTAPDVAVDVATARPLSIDSAALMFLNIIPEATNTAVILEGACNITTLAFQNEAPALSLLSPNPAHSTASAELVLGEKVPVWLDLVAADGRVVAVYSQGEATWQRGRYRLDFNVNALPSGSYLLRLRAGVMSEVRRLVITK